MADHLRDEDRNKVGVDQAQILAQDQQQEIVELMRDIRALFQQANPQTVRAFFQLFQQDVSPVAPQAVLPVQQVDPNERRQRIAQIRIYFYTLGAFTFSIGQVWYPLMLIKSYNPNGQTALEWCISIGLYIVFVLLFVVILYIISKLNKMSKQT